MRGWVWTICLAVVFAGECSPAQTPGGPTPRLSYPKFFAALDLGRPGLSRVADPVREEDWGRAVRSLAQYYRGRETPRWFVEAAPTGQATVPDSATIAEAEKILRHILTSVGIEHHFGPEIDWRYNPTYEPDSPHARDNEWTWQLNRHWIWQTLGRAYRQTGDERYAREFVAQMTHWVRSCPRPADRADQRPFSTWRTIEAGLRMAYSWPDAFYYFLHSPSFTDEALVTMVASFLEHARYLRAFPTRGNWLTMEMDGLYCVGVLFPEFREAGEWRRFAVETLLTELNRQVYPDGAQIELTPGYHNVALRNFLRPLYLARLNGLPMPDSYVRKLERMFDFLMWIMTPDRSVPRFNDAWHVDVPRRLRDGVRLFPERRDYRWIVTEGGEGVPPDHLSHLFPYAGIAVMRSGWDREANYMAVDAGPFGFGHQHEDKLSFVLYLKGLPFVQDAGIYPYDASKWRRYVLSARGHNVIHVDGLEQRRRGQPREAYVVDEPVPLIWRSTDDYDYLEASYGGGFEVFGDSLRVRHTRRILYVRSRQSQRDFWLVLDSLEPFDSRVHRYASTFHLDVPKAEVLPERRVLRAEREDVALEILWAPVQGMSVRIVEGQEELVVQGWMPVLGKRTVRPVPTPHFEVQRRGPFHLAYLFTRAQDGLPRELECLEWASPTGDWRHPAVRVRNDVGGSVLVKWVLEEPPGWGMSKWARTDTLVVERINSVGKVVASDTLIRGRSDGQ